MELVNRVAQSGIITLDLESFIGKQEVVELDISQFLFKGLLLKEKDFRAALREYDWNQYTDQVVAVFCSTDAIVAQWAYMLVSNYLQPVADSYYFGTAQDVKENILLHHIQSMPQDEYADKRVVIKGCGNQPIPDSAYLEISKKLLPVVKTLMFGEACSTVPVYKKR